MSVAGSLSRRLGKLSPGLDTRLSWMRYRRIGPGLRLIDALVSKGDFVIDVGAADALYAARLSQLVGRGGQVYAFEPNPAQFARVEALSARRANVKAFQLGLSDRSGTATLHVPVLDGGQRPGLGSISVPVARASVDHVEVSVALEPLDAVLADIPAKPAFLKCDVEGHELAVLRGAEATLERSRPQILIEIEQRHQDSPIQGTFDYLAGLGYAGYSLHERSLRPLEEFSVERDQLAFTGETFEEVLPQGYVNDFLFVSPGTDMASLHAAVRAKR